MLIFYLIFFVTIAIQLALTVGQYCLKQHLTDGRLLSVQAYADFTVKLNDFHHTDERAGRLFNRYRHGVLLHYLVFIVSILLPLGWEIIAPATIGTSFPLFIIILGVIITVGTVANCLNYSRLRHYYAANQMLLKTVTKTHAAGYFYATNLVSLVMGYELIILDYSIYTTLVTF